MTPDIIQSSDAVMVARCNASFTKQSSDLKYWHWDLNHQNLAAAAVKIRLKTRVTVACTHSKKKRVQKTIDHEINVAHVRHSVGGSK